MHCTVNIHVHVAQSMRFERKESAPFQRYAIPIGVPCSLRVRNVRFYHFYQQHQRISANMRHQHHNDHHVFVNRIAFTNTNMSTRCSACQTHT